MKLGVPAEKRVQRAVDLRDPAHFVAFGFGSGLSPWAPGTVGTLAAIPVYLLLAPLSWPLYLLVLVLVSLAGGVAAHISSRRLGVHDHHGIVIDEFAGFFLTMLCVAPTLANIVAGFLLFRLFDIAKPWPIRWLDRHVHGGVGIMLDDLLAGVFAAVALTVLHGIWPELILWRDG